MERLVVFIFCLSFFSSEATFPSAIIAALLRRSNTYNVLLFPCFGTELNEWIKYLSTHENYAALSTGSKINVPQKRDCEFFELAGHPDFWQGFVVNFDCDCNRLALRDVPLQFFKSVKYKWIIWSREEDWLDDFRRFDLDLTFESDVLLVSTNNSKLSVIHEAFKFQSDWPLNVSLCGRWSEETGLQWLANQQKASRRKNMHRKVISAGLALPELGTVSEEIYNDHHYLQSKDYYGRRDYDLWMLLVAMHNITSSIYITDNYGSVKSLLDLKYDGIIGKLQKKELDLGFSVIRSVERMKVVDYTRADVTLPPVKSINRAAFVFFEPVSLLRWRALYDSFSTLTWLSIGLISFLVAASFKIGVHFEQRMRPHICELVLFIVAAISQQGLEIEPSKISGRLIALTLLVFCFLIYNYYNTALIISLLSPPINLINSMRDLVDSDLDLGSEDIPYNRAFFKTYNISILNEAYEKKMKDRDAFMSLEEGLAKVRQGSFAFEADIRHLFLEMETLFTEGEKCKIRVLDIFPFKVSRALVMQKDSHFNEFVSTGLILFLERGLTSHVENSWDVRKPECFARDYAAAELDELLFAFGVLLVGILGSMIAFGVEILILRKK